MFGTLRQTGGDQLPVPEITAISSIDYEVAIFSHCLGVVIPGLTPDRQLMAGSAVRRTNELRYPGC